MFWSYSAIPDFINAGVCAACFFRLRSTLRSLETPNSEQVQHFRDAYFWLIFAYLVFSLPVFFLPQYSDLLSAAFVLGNGLLFFASANLLAIPVSFYWGSYRRRLFWTFAGVGVVLTLLGLAFPPHPQIDYFQRVTIWNAPVFLDAIYGAWLAIGLIFAMVFFLQQSLISRNRDVRIRAFFIGFGLLFLLVSVIFFYLFAIDYEQVYSNIAAVLGFLITLIGVYYRPKKTNPQFLQP